MTDATHFLKLAAAFVRGRHIQGDDVALPDALRERPLDELSEEELAATVRAGSEAGLRVHKFKRTTDLPRVRRVLGTLRALAPENLLDVGSGRGTFLWPLLDAFPALPVTAIDRYPRRAEDLEAVHVGGVESLSAHELDATDLAFDDDAFDVTTLLEVLEHIPEVGRAVCEAVRVTRRFVVASVPSKEDDNPDHIHLLGEDRLRELFSAAGVARVKCEYVLGHLIAVANLQAESC